MLLKIGRTSDVKRRMQEWRRQCGFRISVLTFYPYNSSTAAAVFSPSVPPRSLESFSSPTYIPPKVPHPGLVERLIHLELADQRVDRACAGCGSVHKEWFEVEGTKEAVLRVDAVIKRWVKWAQDRYGEEETEDEEEDEEDEEEYEEEHEGDEDERRWVVDRRVRLRDARLYS
ncbi:hypothetical protein MMC14_006444 [Varicellaria rhodocarpa]|nr:hypothetical protein [Varicellaria rhodocarpa]